MIKKSILDLVFLGESMRYLRERKEGDLVCYPKKTLELKVIFVKGTIEQFLEYLKEYDMRVTLRAADDLREFLNKIKNRKSASTLTKDEANKLKKIIMSLEKTFIAEAEGVYSFFITDKKIPMDKLTSKHKELFPQGVFSKLSEIAKYDVKEAGLCIAFERSTAVAFHILRATEEVLRQFYCRIVKQKRVRILNWGNITNDWARRRKKPSATTMKNLDYIRDNFRNPTMHPEVRYDIEEAQSLFNLCIDIMSKIIKDPLWKR